MRSLLRRLQTLVFVLLLITIAVGLIFLGCEYYNITRKNYPFGVVIDSLWSKYVDIARVDEKYYFGDNFSIRGDIDVNVNSGDLFTKALTDPEYLKKYNALHNLNNMDINYNLQHDTENRRLLFELNEKIINEEILNYKYLVDDSTGYVYIKDILDGFINGGNDNYFEMITVKENTKSNRNYLYNFIRSSLKKNISSDYITGSDVDTYIDNKNVSTGLVSLRLDNKTVRNIFNGVISDIKDDDRANLIMSSIFDDFSKYKINDKVKYFNKNESYTINIYTSKVLHKPLKIEVVHVDKKNRESISYEGDLDEGFFYYVLDNNVKYSAKYESTKGKSLIDIFNAGGKKIGGVNVTYDKNNVMILANGEFDKKIFDISYSSKHKNYKNDKSFDIERLLELKIMDGESEILNGDIQYNMSIEKGANVRADVSEAVLLSTLDETNKNKYDNLNDLVREKLYIAR